MGWRFRRSVRLFPGVRLNVSRRGLSTTIGSGPGSLSVGPAGMFANVSLPGTGISYRQRLGGGSAGATVPSSPGEAAQAPPAASPVPPPPTEIASASTHALTSAGLAAFRDLLREAETQRTSLARAVAEASEESGDRTRRHDKLASSFLKKRLFPRKLATLREEMEEAQSGVAELRRQLQETRVATEIDLDPAISEPFMLMRDRFAAMTRARKVWDTVSRAEVNRAKERSSASHSISRTEVRFKLASSDLLQTDWTVPHLENANGGDIFVYPAFLLYRVSKETFAVIDCREVTIAYSPSRFIESEHVPEDAETVGMTWEKVNKDGSPDKRFAGNRQLPVVRYGTLRLSSPTGLNEEYMLSDHKLAEAFAQSWEAFRRALPTDGA